MLRKQWPWLAVKMPVFAAAGNKRPQRALAAPGRRDIAAAHERNSKCGGNVTFAVAGVTTAVSNIEAVIGQLCPATLLARPLVASRRSELNQSRTFAVVEAVAIRFPEPIKGAILMHAVEQGGSR
jgi:hypothetical protein